MRCMLLESAGKPLVVADRPVPEIGAEDVLVRVSACGICRTDLHIIDGDLTGPKLPLILGHEIVGHVAAVGASVSNLKIGERVGIPWLGWTCGRCAYCAMHRENLCENARFTGYTIDGGYTEFAKADARYCFKLPSDRPDADMAPLLCAGLIGYRSYRRVANAEVIGIFGFGVAAHIITQLARFEGRTVFAFTRENDTPAQEFARSMGAAWAGGTGTAPPRKLDAAILFAPAGELVPVALKAVKPGGCVVCGGIHMTTIPAFPYSDLWRERSISSIANLTRDDAIGFLDLLPTAGIRTKIEKFRLEDANLALAKVKSGKVTGAAVIAVGGSE